MEYQRPLPPGVQHYIPHCSCGRLPKYFQRQTKEKISHSLQCPPCKLFSAEYLTFEEAYKDWATLIEYLSFSRTGDY